MRVRLLTVVCLLIAALAWSVWSSNAGQSAVAAPVSLHKTDRIAIHQAQFRGRGGWGGGGFRQRIVPPPPRAPTYQAPVAPPRTMVSPSVPRVTPRATQPRIPPLTTARPRTGPSSQTTARFGLVTRRVHVVRPLLQVQRQRVVRYATSLRVAQRAALARSQRASTARANLQHLRNRLAAIRAGVQSRIQATRQLANARLRQIRAARLASIAAASTAALHGSQVHSGVAEIERQAAAGGSSLPPPTPPPSNSRHQTPPNQPTAGGRTGGERTFFVMAATRNTIAGYYLDNPRGLQGAVGSGPRARLEQMPGVNSGIAELRSRAQQRRTAAANQNSKPAAAISRNSDTAAHDTRAADSIRLINRVRKRLKHAIARRIVLDTLASSELLSAARWAQRPSAIPANWIAKPADGVGMMYSDPNHNNFSVRVMRADPNSRHANQRVDYVVVVRGGSFYDVQGNVVDRRGEPSHIPLSEFHNFPFPRIFHGQ